MKVRIESRVRARIEHGVHWNIRRLAAVGEDAAAGEVSVGRETFQKVPHDVDVGVLGGVDHEGHEGQVVVGTDVAH